MHSLRLIQSLLIASGGLLMLGQPAISHPVRPQYQQHDHKQQQQDQSPHKSHDHAAHFDEVNRRGDHAMGFDHQKTTHHFYLKPYGGVIEVSANDPADTVSRQQIRQHLAHIAKLFAAGNFALPTFIHAQKPPAITVMESLKNFIKYEYEETEAGGRIRISSDELDARAAVHDFLRFQIKDHRTGDPLEVRPQD